MIPVLASNASGIDWHNQSYSFVIWPPIPFKASTIDLRNSGFKPPGTKTKIGNRQATHLLGTDGLGRDVTAALINGTSIALMISIGVVLISLIIGLFFGTAAGYFGNSRFQFSRFSLFLLVILTISACYIQWIIIQSFHSLILSIIFSFFIWIIWFGIFAIIHRFKARNRINIPIDAIIMRGIELFRSVPVLVLLLVLTSVLKSNGVLPIIFIISIFSWTAIARYSRAEALKLRDMPFVLSSQISGISDWRTITRHILPNVLTPVIVSATLLMAGSVLAESALSFLGIGLEADTVSWGSLLSESRKKPSAWWIAVFPGLAIYIYVLIWNNIGEQVSTFLQRKKLI
jgi:peptide/nickel transport system permease protein